MPRARNIKYSFFTNDELAEKNEPLGRLLFAGLWTLADCNGNLEWRNKKVKAQVLPYDDCDIEKLGINLDKSGFIRFYSDGENLYCNVCNFIEHQNPHKNERDAGGKVPVYSDNMRQAIDFKGFVINLDKSGLKRNLHPTDPADSLILITDSLNLKPEEKTFSPSSEPPPKKSKPKIPEKYASDVETVLIHWHKVIHNENPRIELSDSRRVKIFTRLKKDCSVEDLIQCVNGCASEAWTKKNNSSIGYLFRNRENVEKFFTKSLDFGPQESSVKEGFNARMKRELNLGNTYEGETKNV